MDNLPYAKDAFVIMVVGLNAHWKVPIAYYLVNGISAEEKSNIIKSCLHQLHETGIIIKTITFDGAANNMAMVSLLGANLNYADLKPNFKHPLTEDNVHIVLDPCHMVKLIRNCLGDWGLLFDKNNKPIKWVYFKHLVDMQNVTGLHAATKIRTRHIHYHREKMKVRLATQVFSNSVADALEYCCKDLKNNLFEDAEATIEFCRRINNIFDLLNSRNFLSKSPFNKLLSDNFLNLNIFIDESIDYLNGIQCLEKPPKYGKRSVLQSERKTGFLGLITCLKTIKNLYSELIETKLLQFLLTYKFNQDHIELLFGAIRAKGGFNNNPTVAQFEAAYKSIIINAEVKCPSTANALALDNTSILRISSAPPKKKDEQSEMLDLLCAAGTEIIETEDILDIYEHRNYLNDVVTYIAGFVVYKIKKNILCTVCEKSLGTKESGSALIGRKNRGGLIVPNPDVIEICKIAERVIRGYQRIDESNVVKRITIEYEIELISLMLNKDEFILYITQQYNQNDCCTPLEPIIWAVHFNIPKFQRLPVLENILLRSTAYIKKCYSFLPNKQIIGKTYEALGIPTVCGEPDKCFLNAYKKYKPYYPVRYPKNEKKPLLCNVHHSTGIKPGAQYSSINSTASEANLEIICSTPNTKTVYSFNVSPLLSPIKTPIQEENHYLSTDSFCNIDSVLVQNIPKNNIILDNKQIVAIPKILEFSGFEMLNTSQQTLLSIQNGDISNINQSEIQFISGDPNYFQHENYIAKLNNSSLSNASKSSQDKSHNRKVKINSNTNTNSIYFENNFKKVDYKVLDLKKEKSTNVIRQSLNEKLKKNISLFKKNKWVKKLITSPSVNINMSKQKQIKYNVKKSTSESWTRINETFNDILFSDFNGTSQTQTIMKHKQSKKMYHNEVAEDSSLEYYNTGENDVNSWYVELQNNNREEDSISSINSSTKSSNKLNDYDHKIYELSIFHSSLPIFSDTSIFSSNSTMNSEKLVSIQQQLISWTQDSSNTIDDEDNYKKQNNGTVIFNNTLSEETQFSI